ncbi:ABC transporter ATP-binding protein [Dysosmobacter welbionis]|uniref:ABC transporter ATP-binding protein n=1 Tax=Dysosmobacter welbionis TaxID=2093857 RepID=UPI002354ED6D|nr:ABC transporter ATP-binding protein [Dysosmobacter welbionis]
MSKIELKHIDKFYGKNHVLKDLNLTIEDGDFMTLLGPSGCGKTTTLRVVSGLEKPQNGFIYMDGKEIVNAAEAYYAPPSQRNLNLVFQSYALWPHMTVFENVSFGLKIKKIPSAEIEKWLPAPWTDADRPVRQAVSHRALRRPAAARGITRAIVSGAPAAPA